MDAEEEFEEAREMWRMFPDSPEVAAKLAFLEGYKRGYGVEQLQAINYKVCENKFDQWWEREAP